MPDWDKIADQVDGPAVGTVDWNDVADQVDGPLGVDSGGSGGSLGPPGADVMPPEATGQPRPTFNSDTLPDRSREASALGIHAAVGAPFGISGAEPAVRGLSPLEQWAMSTFGAVKVPNRGPVGAAISGAQAMMGPQAIQTAGGLVGLAGAPETGERIRQIGAAAGQFPVFRPSPAEASGAPMVGRELGGIGVGVGQSAGLAAVGQAVGGPPAAAALGAAPFALQTAASRYQKDESRLGAIVEGLITEGSFAIPLGGILRQSPELAATVRQQLLNFAKARGVDALKQGGVAVLDVTLRDSIRAMGGDPDAFEGFIQEAGHAGAAGAGLGAVAGAAHALPAEARAPAARRAESADSFRATGRTISQEVAQGGTDRAVTLPERPETIALQIDEVKAGDRPAMLIPKGTRMPAIQGTGLKATPTADGMIIYHPDKADPAQLRQAVAEGRTGDALGYGIPAKPEPGTEAGVVTVRTPEGVEKRAVVTDAEHLGAVTKAAEEAAGPGDRVGLETPEDVLQARTQPAEETTPSTAQSERTSTPSPDSMPYPQLRAEAKRLGVLEPGKNGKAALVERVEKARAARTPPATPADTAGRTTPVAAPAEPSGRNPSPESTREPWQMTIAEYRETRRGERFKRGGYFNREGRIQEEHKQAITTALQLGKPVPVEVLREYPQFAKEAQRAKGHGASPEALSREEGLQRGEGGQVRVRRDGEPGNAQEQPRAPGEHPAGAEQGKAEEAAPGVAEPDLTSPRKAWVARDRARMLLGTLDSPGRRAFAEDLQKAHDEGIPDRALSIATDINSRPDHKKALTTVESAGLTDRLVSLKDEHKSLAEKLAAAKDDPAAQQDIAVQIGRLQQEADVITQALDSSGSERGRQLVAQKLTLNEAHDIVSVKARARVAKGEPLTAKETARFEEMTKKLEETSKRVTELEKRVHEQAAETAIRREAGRRRTMKAEEAAKDFADTLAKAKALLKMGCR